MERDRWPLSLSRQSLNRPPHRDVHTARQRDLVRIAAIAIARDATASARASARRRASATDDCVGLLASLPSRVANLSKGGRHVVVTWRCRACDGSRGGGARRAGWRGDRRAHPTRPTGTRTSACSSCNVEGDWFDFCSGTLVARRRRPHRRALHRLPRRGSGRRRLRPGRSAHLVRSGPTSDAPYYDGRSHRRAPGLVHRGPVHRQLEAPVPRVAGRGHRARLPRRPESPASRRRRSPRPGTSIELNLKSETFTVVGYGTDAFITGSAALTEGDHRLRRHPQLPRRHRDRGDTTPSRTGSSRSRRAYASATPAAPCSTATRSSQSTHGRSATDAPDRTWSTGWIRTWRRNSSTRICDRHGARRARRADSTVVVTRDARARGRRGACPRCSGFGPP